MEYPDGGISRQTGYAEQLGMAGALYLGRGEKFLRFAHGSVRIIRAVFPRAERGGEVLLVKVLQSSCVKHTHKKQQQKRQDQSETLIKRP